MALRLILCAMTEQRHCPCPGQLLQKPQREFLAVILDLLVPPIDLARFTQFLQITAAVFPPRYLTCQDGISQLLAWPKVCHPDVVTITGEAPAAPACRQNPQTILRWLDFRVNRLGLEHEIAVLSPGPPGISDPVET